MSVNSKMTALANEIRELSGTSEAIGLDSMKIHVNEANNEVTSQVELLAQAVAALEGKAAGSGGTQAIPVISVNSSTGLITATAGTKSSTHQLAFQPAKTITPGPTSQIVVSSGYYTGGNITVTGDSNLVAENIKNGVNIFGVSGTLIESDGMSSGEQVEWSANEDAIISKTLSSYFNDRVKSICNYAFYSHGNLITVSFPVATYIGHSAFGGCDDLTTVSFPAATSILPYAFYGCRNLFTASFPAATSIWYRTFAECYALTTVNFPVATTIGEYAFTHCSKLTSINFPLVTTINKRAFEYCSNLTTVSFPACTTISHMAFEYCTNLSAIYLMASSVCSLSQSATFNGTKITNSGSIYVPASLLTSYKTATNWAYFSSRFVAYDE